MITSTRYQQFLAIAELGSYRRAASALRVSQPALTKSVQALEAELGVRLFDRQARGVQLTEFGERVLGHARQMVAAEQGLRHELGLIAGLSAGRIDVALGPYPSVVSGYAAAARLSRQHAQLRIALHVADWRTVTRAVAAGSAELGVAELSDAAEHAELQTELVAQHRGHFFCRTDHPILRRAPCGWAELLQYPWATTRIPPRVVRALPADLGRAGRRDAASGDLVPAVEIDVPMQLAEFARDSDTLVLGLFTLLQADLQARSLRVVPLAMPPMASEYGFIRHRRRPLSLAAQAYMQAVRESEQAFAVHEARLVAEHEGAAAPPRRRAPR